VARQTALRIREHCESHDKHDAHITFHGGEPLLGGVQHLEMLSSVIAETFADSGINVGISMQSNGLLFTPEIGDLMLARRISMGISLDGPPEVNDLYRVDHQGKPTSTRLEERLSLLTSPRYRRIFNGFLCVINIATDPLMVAKYLLSYNPRGIDFLLPLNNYDRRPPGKESMIDTTPYGDWLIKIFDYWLNQKNETQIGIFISIIRQIFGLQSLRESLGLAPVDLIVVETNGDIEAVDSLKSTFHGATRLGYNVFENDFNTVAADFAVRNRQSGAETLCQKCKDCPVVNICGGGYLPHRYSVERGFDNPSIYSADLEKLIRHIHAVVFNQLENIQFKELKYVTSTNSFCSC